MGRCIRSAHVRAAYAHSRGRHATSRDATRRPARRHAKRRARGSLTSPCEHACTRVAATAGRSVRRRAHILAKPRQESTQLVDLEDARVVLVREVKELPILLLLFRHLVLRSRTLPPGDDHILPVAQREARDAEREQPQYDGDDHAGIGLRTGCGRGGWIGRRERHRGRRWSGRRRELRWRRRGRRRRGRRRRRQVWDARRWRQRRRQQRVPFDCMLGGGVQVHAHEVVVAIRGAARVTVQMELVRDRVPGAAEWYQRIRRGLDPHDTLGGRDGIARRPAVNVDGGGGAATAIYSGDEACARGEQHTHRRVGMSGTLRQ